MIPLRLELVQDPPKPEWLKIRPPHGEAFAEVKGTLRELGLNTVCESAHCPNLSECWSGGTATFMVLGNVCTRGCRFCAVDKSAKGEKLDEQEPAKLAEAVKRWNLNYIVVTSVDRDDLPDQGAGHFAECIRELKKSNPNLIVEVLIPDFRGSEECIQTIVAAKPHVIAHNIETTEDLQGRVRDPRAGYWQSIGVLQKVKGLDNTIFTKSAVMLGLGETKQMVLKSFNDLRGVGCDFITIGQYMRPSKKHLPVRNYLPPDLFKYYEKKALERGFKYAAAGPFIRSSYRAGEFFVRAMVEKRRGLESKKVGA